MALPERQGSTILSACFFNAGLPRNPSDEGESAVMKHLAFAVLAIALIGAYIPAQETGQNANPQEVIAQFTRAMKLDGYTLSFVLLNDKTVDALFQAPGKYAVRARANQATAFYVQGMLEKDVTVETDYSVEQDGQTIPGAIQNIKNFEGGKVSKGERISGIFQLEKKLDLTHPFKIVGSRGNMEFKLSDEALRLMQK
jgi:hypothetical protein